MLRYGRTYDSGAFRQVAPQTYVAQTSLSWGCYDSGLYPIFELETGVTIDSGIFVDFRGDSLEERFISWLTIRYRRVSLETWNDKINRKDYGPTYGIRATVDILPCLLDVDGCFQFIKTAQWP